MTIGSGGSRLTPCHHGEWNVADRITLLEKTIKPSGNTYLLHRVFAAERQAQKRMNIDVSADKLFKDSMEEVEWL